VRSMDIAEAALAYGIFTDSAGDRQADPAG
jgi:hypothetical protein